MITVLWPEAPFWTEEDAGEPLLFSESEQPQTFRHVFRARRAGPGERLRLADGRGRARWATVQEVRRDRAELVLGEKAPSGEPELDLALLVAPPKPARASWLVEKATELGVREIRFLITERAPRSYGAAQVERLRRVAAAALEQCHGSRLPLVDGPHPWSELESLVSDRPRRRILDFESGDPGAPAAESLLESTSEGAVLAVGPEGGWTQAERARGRALSFVPWSLGGRTLRLETAAIVAAGSWLTPATAGGRLR